MNLQIAEMERYKTKHKRKEKANEPMSESETSSSDDDKEFKDLLSISNSLDESESHEKGETPP